MNAGESSRASHVWRVEGRGGPVILRRPWWTSPDVSAFMLGLTCLFGVDPRDLHATAGAYRFWRELGVWAVPQVLGITNFRGGTALQVAFVPGEPPRDLREADAAELGRRVAAVHAHAAGHFGPVTGGAGWPLADFSPRALRVVRKLANHFEPNTWAAHWPEVEAAFAAAPAPTRAVPMLLDWAGSQFVWRDGEPFALVDVEASALAPPEFDLCLWEVLLDAAGAQAFRSGYGERLPFPDLNLHRTAYRLILRALEVEGSPPLRDWLALPPLFDS
ncbi:phosphotransferase [Deinococcus sp. DB0503]|uniref:phosphotransferase n=1 Tax=Deinococcus sp. DB0503 TaxID=2479203 RepID=UPI00351C4169